MTAMEYLSRTIADDNAWFDYKEQIGMEFYEFVAAYTQRIITGGKYERGGQAFLNLLTEVRPDMADLVIDTNDCYEEFNVRPEIWELVQTNWGEGY